MRPPVRLTHFSASDEISKRSAPSLEGASKSAEGSTLKAVDGGSKFGSMTAVLPAPRQTGVASADLTVFLLSEKEPRELGSELSPVGTLYPKILKEL